MTDSVDLDYLRNAILKKDIDAIFDIMLHHPNRFIIEQVLKDNPLLKPDDFETVEGHTIEYPSLFLAYVAVYAFQVFNSADRKEENIKDIGQFIYDLSARQLYDRSNDDNDFHDKDKC